MFHCSCIFKMTFGFNIFHTFPIVLLILRREERVGKYLISLFLNSFFSLLPTFVGCFSLLPDFSPFSLISTLTGLCEVTLQLQSKFLWMF